MLMTGIKIPKLLLNKQKELVLGSRGKNIFRNLFKLVSKIIHMLTLDFFLVPSPSSISKLNLDHLSKILTIG